MRIVSLVPHATELLFALGLGDDIVGVTHECDYPEAARDIQPVTEDVLPPGLSAAQIDAAVRERTDAGESIYALDEELLRELEPDLIARTARRADIIRLAVRDVPRPRVAALEWLDPVYVAGHWTPQLIDMAGGIDLLGSPGEPSEQSSWELVAATEPEIVVAVDASSYYSRPGPRLIDGLELLAHILHPDRVPQAPAEALQVEL